MLDIGNKSIIHVNIVLVLLRKRFVILPAELFIEFPGFF